MVSVITFLTLTNIALGYGLAVYVQRQFGVLLWSRSRTAPPASAPADSTDEVENTSTASVEPPREMPTRVEPAPVLEASAVKDETAAPATESATAESAPTAAVDEENVLAGIEEFRSQLAKMSSPADELSEEPERELVGAAN